MSLAFEVNTAPRNDTANEETSSTDIAGKGFSSADANMDKENIWDESKLKLIEYSLNNVRNDTINIRNDKYMQKELDDGGFGAADDFDASAPAEDIVGSGSEDEKFVIKGGLKKGDSLTRIAKCINDANVDCNSASDNLESTNLFDWKKTKTGYDALGNAWDSTVNFLKHPWTSMQKESNHSIDEKIESNVIVPDSVNLTKNKTSSAWENTTQFVPVIANDEMATNIFETIGGPNASIAKRNQDLQKI